MLDDTFLNPSGMHFETARWTMTVSYTHLNGTSGTVSVKTKEDIPKEKIFACVQALRGIEVQAPVHIGDVILENVAGTGDVYKRQGLNTSDRTGFIYLMSRKQLCPRSGSYHC